MAETRDDKKYFTDTLKNNYGIDLPPTVYDYMCHEQKINSKIKHSNSSNFENAREMVDRNICLPMYCGLTDEERIYIIQSINEAISG